MKELDIDYELKNNDYENEDITIEVFARQMARAFMAIKSSHCYFIFQVAFGENKDWDDVEKVCNRILKEIAVK